MSRKILLAAVLGLVALAIAATAGRPPLPTVGSSAVPLAGPIAQAERVLRVPVGDLDVAYRVLGQGEPLVLITGFRATIDDWDPTLLAELAAHYLVIAFDNRGMGGTSAPPGEFSIEQLADDATGFLSALGLERARVLGYSMGGYIAQELALRHPERVARLVLLATACGGSEGIPANPEAIQIIGSRDGDPAERAAQILGVLLPAEWIAQNQAYLRSVTSRPRERSLGESIARQEQAMARWPGTCERLPQLHAPTLVLAGTLDQVLPPGNAVILAERIPGAWLAQFAGGGHGMQLQYPKQLAATIHNFFTAP
jgi:pimeloyl-ACP methyl ester carboxylesterase